MQGRVGREEWIKQLDLCRHFYENDVGVWHSYSTCLDFLGLAIEYKLVDYVKYTLRDPHSFTPAYKSYLLTYACLTFSNKFSIEYWTPWFEIINHLLSQGCKSELGIVPATSQLYKMTGLEAFILSLFHLFTKLTTSKDDIDCATRIKFEAISDSVIETLKHFQEIKANFMQPVYGFYGGGYLFSGSDLWEESYFWRMKNVREQRRGSIFCKQVFVEWSLLGLLSRAVEMYPPFQQYTYLQRRLREFVTSVNLEGGSVHPKIIAVRNLPNESAKETGDWIKQMKRVDATIGKDLLDNITQSVNWDPETWFDDIKRLETELKSMVDSFMHNGDSVEDLSDYLFIEHGLGKSWPQVLKVPLANQGYTPRRAGTWAGWKKKILPVKYMDQLNSLV